MMLLNSGVEEDSWDSFGLQGDQTVHPKGNQSWIFIGRIDAEAETPIVWPPDANNSLIGKDPDAGKDWRLEEKGTTEDEMVGWHHWLNGLEFEQAWGLVMNREAWYAAAHGTEKSQTWLSDWTELTEGLNIHWWESNGSKMADKWTLVRPWSSISKLNDTPRGTTTVPKHCQKAKEWNSWKSPPLPQNSWGNLPLVSIWNYPAYKN